MIILTKRYDHEKKYRIERQYYKNSHRVFHNWCWIIFSKFVGNRWICFMVIRHDASLSCLFVIEYQYQFKKTGDAAEEIMINDWLKARKMAARLVVFFVVMLSSVMSTANTDLHWLWDDRCSSCHGHSGEFSRQFLSASNGVLNGTHHVDDLRLFLHNHYLSGQLVDEMYSMLLVQANHSARFEKECSGCHQNAASFVRRNLAMQGNELTIRTTGRNVKSYLEYHRKLTDTDVDFFTNLLTRVAKETGLN